MLNPLRLSPNYCLAYVLEARQKFIFNLYMYFTTVLSAFCVNPKQWVQTRRDPYAASYIPSTYIIQIEKQYSPN